VAVGQSNVIVQPHASAIALFEFVERFQDGDMAFLCFAESINECYAGRNSTVRLRVEGGGSVRRRTFVVKTHGLHGVKVPFSVSASI